MFGFPRMALIASAGMDEDDDVSVSFNFAMFMPG